ncbi:MAG: response regulator [Elusimicrobia bacterium]|nr:response regulator [Elusimicrobiota bacterium]
MNEPRRKRVLLVDDNADLRRSVVLLLAGEAEVVEAATGEDGVRLAREEAVDLFLLDLTLPDMGGLEVLENCRALAPATPALMLTGEHDVELAKRALDRGASAYVTKPYHAESLRREVRRLLGLDALGEGDAGRPWKIGY